MSLIEEALTTHTVLGDGPDESILFDLEIPDGLSARAAFNQFVRAYQTLLADGAFDC